MNDRPTFGRPAPEARIPTGPYCYTLAPGENDARPQRVPCPFWKRRGDWPAQADGYCRFLKCGDSSKARSRNGAPIATMLLWDQVKECGVNMRDPFEETGEAA